MLSAFFRSTYLILSTLVVGHPLPISLSGNLRNGFRINTTMKKYIFSYTSRIQRLLQAVMNLSQLAETDARREEAQPTWCPQRRSLLVPSRTDSSNLHVIQRWSALSWGSAVGLKVSARCSDAIRCLPSRAGLLSEHLSILIIHPGQSSIVLLSTNTGSYCN